MSKKELQNAIIDCLQHGCIPKCPQCNQSRPKFVNGSSGIWSCKGFFDEDGIFHHCGFRGELVKIPWVCGNGNEI